MSEPTMMKSKTLFLVTTALVATSAFASCECGYQVTTPATPDAGHDPNPGGISLFTDVLETDFLHVYDLPQPEDRAEFGWAPQAYNVSAAEARGPYGKAASVDNVIVNPIPSPWDWGGPGEAGGDPGLQLWVRGKNDLLDIAGGDERVKAIRTGELAALRQDVVFGSFRVGLKMSAVPGTCAAFFWYRNDTSEIDLEYLSREVNADNHTSPARLNLVLQTPQSAARGFDASGTPYFKIIPIPFLPSSGYHEYRIDWLPASITFFVDGLPMWTLTDENVIPKEPGHMILNHWSNGDPNWSGGPPEQDAVLTVSYVKAFFNSSDAQRHDSFRSSCTKTPNSACLVQDANQSAGIDPAGNNGNVSGRTPFITDNPGWAVPGTHVKGDAGRLRLTRAVLWMLLGHSMLIMMWL